MDCRENTKGLQHIGIPTDNMQETIEFYKMLGFEPVFQTDNQGSLVTFLELKGLIVEAYESKAAMRNGAIDHFAIDVGDLRAQFDYLMSKNVKLLEPITFLPFWENGVEFFVIEGPNKEKIEFARYL